MNRVETLFKDIVRPALVKKAFNAIVERKFLTQERCDEIRKGRSKISPQEAELISEALDGAITAELLLQLNEDDLASGKVKQPRAKTSKSPLRPIGPYRPNRDEW